MNKNFMDIMHIKRFPKVPILGNLNAFRQDRLKLFLDIEKYCGDIGIFHLGTKPIIMVNSSDDIHDVLVTYNNHTEKIPIIKKYLQPLLGNSILNAHNDIHKPNKKLMAPAFHRHHILQHADDIVHIVRKSIASWNDGTILDINSEMMKITLCIIGKLLFDADIDADGATKPVEMINALMRVSSHITDQIGSLFPLPLSWPTPGNKQFWHHIRTLDQTLHSIIEEKTLSHSQGRDILSMLMSSTFEDGSSMNKQQIKDEINTLFFAGHDTTGNALTWTWYLLAHNPDVYRRLQTEVRTSPIDQPLRLEDLKHLPYSLQVFKETLRLFPTAYIMARHVVKPIQLKDYYIPVGADILITPYVVHRRAEYYPEPDVFNPDRFLPHEEQTRSRYTYIPFGGGPHACIGSGLALLEAQLIIATITQHCTLQLVNNDTIKPNPLITIGPEKPILMRVCKHHPGQSSECN